MAGFLGFSGRIGGWRECPHRTCWRTERDCGRTFSFCEINDLQNNMLKNVNCLENLRALCALHPLQRQAGRCAACKAVFDPDLEQGGHTNIVVRRDTATGEMTRALCTGGAVPAATRGRPHLRWPMREPYAGKPARTVLRGWAGRKACPATRHPDRTFYFVISMS
jgi:hypothetical protein